MSRCSRAAHFVDNAGSEMKSWNCKYEELDVASEAQMVALDSDRDSVEALVNVFGFASAHAAPRDPPAAAAAASAAIGPHRASVER